MSSTPYVVDIAVDAVIDALKAFLQPFCPNTLIVQAQRNRVAMPHDSFVLLTPLFEVDLETPIVTRTAHGQISILGPTKIDVQVDFYGETAGDQCKAVKTVYRTPYTVAQFPAGIAPLFCSDGHQGPLTNDQAQYESRWTLTASLQYNPTVYIPVQTATELHMNIVEDLT